MVLESNTLDVLFVKDGQQGEDGKILYTWIKYAKDANGTGITDDPNGAVYIGISYNNESSTESNDPTHYAWTKIQGADGKKGEDAYTIFLENENISFATDKNRNPLSEQAYTSGITIMKGAKPVTDFTIGDIAKTQGIAVAKTDTAIAISVVNGNPLPNDSGEIEIPITVGGTVFKKILTWTCAKKGDKGKDGTSIKIASKSVTYQTSTSGTTAPTGTWSTSVPTVNNGQYLWTKTTVQYSDGNKTEAYSVSYKGTNGTNGTSVTVSKTEVAYQVSTSGTTAPTGTWSTTMPSCDQGQYLWTKTYVKYSDGKDTTSYSVSYKGVDGEKFAFNMLRETNQGSKHWVNMGASGKYSVESITTEDSINAVKLICTEPIASNEWQFCDFSDYEMLKSLKASTTYTLSYDIKTNRSGKILHNIKTGGGQKVFFANDIACKVLGNETWEHVSLKMTSGTTLPNLDRQVIYMFGDALSKVGYSIIKNLKLTECIVDTPWAPHPEDLEGRGVSETVQYYLATSQASGVTSSTSGWSTDITTQKLTADKKYLWNCYQTKYSDGTSEPISTPNVIGVYGDKGNGIVASVQRPNKTEFWWSQVGAVGHKDTFDGSSNTRNNCRVGDIFAVMGTSTEGNSHTVYYKSTTDSGDLAGECINHVIAESGADAKNLTITPSSQYFKSTDGGKTFAPDTITIKPTIQGEINFGKWQYSIDGGVSFSDVVSGQKGLTISNNVLTISKDSSLYSDAVTMITFRAVADDSSFYDTCSIAKFYDVSDIGDGRNLLWNSNFAKTDETINTSTYTTWGLILKGSTYTATIDTSVKHNNFNTLKVIGTKGGENGGQDLIYRIKGLNLDEVKFTETGVKYTLSFYAKASIACNFSARYAYDSYAKDTNVALSTDWKRYEIQMHPTTTSYQTTLIFKMDAASTVWFSEFKLEKGSSATGYSTAPEDVQTAILSTKSEISDVSLKVDNNKQAIEQRVEKTTYQQNLNLVKGDISKANEGLNKWRYEIYPKSLFADKPEDQSKYDIGVFIRNKNLTPSRTLVFDDNKWTLLDYENNYIGYGLTFVKMSAKKTFSTKWAHSSSCSIYVNGKLIISDKGTVRLDSNNTGRDFSCTFIEGWNCIEFVMQETIGNEWFFFKDAISALSECQLMNCYYGTPVARQSHITNQLVQNTTDINGISGSVQQVMSTVGGSGKIDEFVNNYSTWKKKVDGIETRVGETYVTKNDFDGLEIGGVNLFVKSTASRGWWISDTGVLNANGGWGYSDYINVSGMKNYIASGFTNLGISPATCFYDSNKTFISAVQSTNQNSQDSKRKTLPIPSNAKYMRFSFMLVDIDTLKIEQGTKATAYSPAPEDDEINGQNLVSNLPSNWEQGTVTEGSAIGTTYANTKSPSAGSIRPKELIPVSGDITISIAYSNQSKKPIRHWIAAYDVNKNYLGNNYVSNAWNSFPRTLDMKDAKYIAIMVGYTDSSAIAPSDISQICLKIERGTSATAFTLAPEDVNGRINSVETIATQTATEIGWLINRNGSTASSLKLTESALTAIAENINLTGRVKFSSLSADAKQGILNSFEVGGRNLLVQKNITQGYLSTDGKGSFISSGGVDQTSDWIDVSGNKYITITLYEDFTNTNNSGRYCEYDADKNCINTVVYNPRQKSSIIIELKTTTKYIRVTAIECKTRRYKIETGNKATDWTPAPEDVAQDATDKSSKALTDAKEYSKNSVEWVTNNGKKTQNLYSMISNWANGAISDTATINGGWIDANTITAKKIAIGDFTNYCQLEQKNASEFGFSVEENADGVWFVADFNHAHKESSHTEWLLSTDSIPCEASQQIYVEYDIYTTVKGDSDYVNSGLGIIVADGSLKWDHANMVSVDQVKGSASGTAKHISTMVTLPSTTRYFGLYLRTLSGNPSGALKIRNVVVRKAVTGKLIVDGGIAADKIATDAIKSRNYISSGGTQGSFLDLADGSFTSPNLSWDSNGNLIAKNANIIGNLTAGTVGEWKIDKYIYSRDKMFFDINKHNGQSIYNKNSTNNLFLGDGKVSSFYWFTTQNNTFIIENGNSPQYATGPAGISFGTNIAQGQIELYESVYPGNIIQDYEQTSHTSELSISGSKISFSYYDSNGSSFSDSPYTYIMADYARFYGDIFVQGSITTDEGVDVGGKLQASSIAAKNGGLIETAGTVYGGGEIQCGGGQMRIIGGNYGILLRNDGSDFYILSTDSGSPWGSWNSKRPFRINLANGIPYFEYGIIIPNENYLLGNGYQLARGTSWGGVCIGDDSKGLRLYGTSIWASHSISTSDENLKENFTTLDQYEDFYMNLNPIGFNYIGDYDGKKTHFGFGAHKIEDILESEGYDSDKFAVVTHRPLVQEDIKKRFGKDVEVDIETEYGVSYTEFIALNTHMIQKTRRELEQVKQEKADLEARLQAIETKLRL